MQLHLLKSVYTKKHLQFFFNLKSLNTKNDCNLQDEEMTRILDEKQKLIAEILQVKDKNYKPSIPKKNIYRNISISERVKDFAKHVTDKQTESILGFSLF